VFCNPPYLMWSGRMRDELIGQTLAQLYGDEAWQRARPAFERAFRGATTSYERQLRHGTLTGRWARIQVFPDADAGGLASAIPITRSSHSRTDKPTPDANASGPDASAHRHPGPGDSHSHRRQAGRHAPDAVCLQHPDSQLGQLRRISRRPSRQHGAGIQ